METPNYLINNFRNVVEECRLREIRVEGSKYTWCNKQEKNLIFERLDRFYNAQWEVLFTVAVKRHVQRLGL